MSRSLALFGIGLLFGGGAGFLMAASAGVTLDGHDHADPNAHGGGGHETVSNDHNSHHGEPMALDAADAPAVRIAVTKDPMSGWNLQVMTDNFRFAPESASTAHVPGEGHAHVYVNGVKLSRLYASWMHLGDLPDGATIEVTLNSNDHKVFQVGGQSVTASHTLTQ